MRLTSLAGFNVSPLLVPLLGEQEVVTLLLPPPLWVRVDLTRELACSTQAHILHSLTDMGFVEILNVFCFLNTGLVNVITLVIENQRNTTLSQQSHIYLGE